MKCKGCTGEIEYTPLTEVRERFAERYYNAGPALTHTLPYCEWFKDTPASQIVAYINVATYKTEHGTTVSKDPSRLFDR